MKIDRLTRRLVRAEAAQEAAAAAEGADHEWVALSSADFLVPPVHVELLLAYNATAPQACELEQGLRSVLSAYPEWAGRIEHSHPAASRPAIVLNNAGAVFIEASADGPLHGMQPSFDHPSLLLRDLIPPHFGSSELLLVQVTRFSCGGMSIGVAWHHQVADAEATISFMHAWTLIVKGLASPSYSPCDRSLLMAKHPPQPTYEHKEFKRPQQSKDTKSLPSLKQELVVKKLCFNAELLRKIKEEARKGGGEDFTRFESLMGHLWRCITKARELEKGDTSKESVTRLSVAVNARKRMNPKIENDYFGNVVCPTCATTNIDMLIREQLGYAAKLVKEAINQVDEEFVRSSLDYVEIKERHPYEGGRTDGSVLTPNVSVTSWATLPLYELDFGTGRPFFAGNAFVPFEGLLIILPPPFPNDGSLHVVLGLFDFAMNNLLSMYDSIF
ncbi:hypothetical protein L7F22_051758 [Adiantum nelumboides]|nr:hypothetical protein [Adiantum nelumboides]